MKKGLSSKLWRVANFYMHQEKLIDEIAYIAKVSRTEVVRNCRSGILSLEEVRDYAACTGKLPCIPSFH